MTSARRKLLRGIEQVDAICRETSAYENANAYTLRTEREPRTAEDVLYRCFAVERQATSDDWPLMIGEAVHNLRASLDHAVYPYTRSKRTGFPIFDELCHFEVNGRPMITRLPAAKRALIESVQPFKTAPEHPKTDPLWFLHDLWNLDKHRNLSTVAVGIGSAAIVYRGHKDANITFIERVTEKDLEEGTRVLTFTVTGPKADEMKVEPDISYHVSVEGRPLVDSLKSIRRSVYCFLGEWETGSPVSSTEYVATLLPFGPETT